MDIGPLRKNEFYSMTSNMSFVMEKVTRHHHVPFSALFPTVVLEQEQLSNLSITCSVKLVIPVEASGLAERWWDTEGTLTSASGFIGETRPGDCQAQPPISILNHVGRKHIMEAEDFQCNGGNLIFVDWI